jgi:hypothetical protein
MKLMALICFWHLAWQDVSSLMVAEAGIKLMVFICSWHSWLDSW